MMTFLVSFDVEAVRIGSYGKTDRWLDEGLFELVSASTVYEARTTVQNTYHSWSDSFQQRAINLQVKPT